jgi:hypothetical protein
MTIADIFAEARALVDATSTSYVDADLLRRVNNAYEDIAATLINSDGTWEFDDSNYTTNPIGTITMIDGQSSYTFLDTFLDVDTVKIMDINGIWHILDPIDQSQIDFPLENYLITKYFPHFYAKEGNTLKLYPAPSGTIITLTNGLKVEFKRTAQLFLESDVTTGTLTPGFASPFHVLLAYKAALPYAMSYKKDRVPLINSEIQRLQIGLIEHYSEREKDKRKVMTSSRIRFR